MGFTPENPPNAALVVDTPQQEDDVLLVELMNPTYEAATQTLTYEADVLQEYRGEGLKPLAAKQQDHSIAPEFGRASLFIDDCADQLIVCYESDSWFANPIGSLGPFGFCWSFGDLCCKPCQHNDRNYWIKQCNAAFAACKNSCYPRTSGCW